MDRQKEIQARIGEIIGKARKAKKLSIEDVVADTNIRATYIKALENGDFDYLPGGFYTKGYIKSYAEYLGLDSNDVIKEFEQQLEEEENLGDSAVIKAEKTGQNIPVMWAVISIMAAILVYLFWVYQNNQFRLQAPGEKTQQIVSALTKEKYTVNLLAKNNVKLTVQNKVGEVLLDNELLAGEAFFLPDYDHVVVKSGDMGLIEFYIDGELVASTDNLEHIDNGIVLDINKMLANLVIGNP